MDNAINKVGQNFKVKLLLEHIPRYRAVYNTHICGCKAIAFDADQAKRNAFMYLLNTIMI